MKIKEDLKRMITANQMSFTQLKAKTIPVDFVKDFLISLFSKYIACQRNSEKLKDHRDAAAHILYHKTVEIASQERASHSKEKEKIEI